MDRRLLLCGHVIDDHCGNHRFNPENLHCEQQQALQPVLFIEVKSGIHDVAGCSSLHIIIYNSRDICKKAPSVFLIPRFCCLCSSQCSIALGSWSE